MSATTATRQYRHAIPTMMRLKDEGNMNPSTQDLANALFIECNKWLKENGYKEFIPSQNLGWTFKGWRNFSQQSAHKTLSETIKHDNVQI
ncbi:hypothetical protein H8356DRAFT_1349400 [Neocallimastix lanati (nom. inval.)]|nr:hypothetical protein H8356DRAFT_1349400 [Neocallimastix sp. JGI-2020a]